MSVKADRELEAMQAAYTALANLTEEEQRRVVDWLTRKLNLGSSPSQTSSVTPSAGHVGAAGPKQGIESLSPKKFIVEKRPQSDVERVTCLAYYLTHFRETPEFKTKDITFLNREAGQPRLSNPTMAVANATRGNQFLVPTSAGRKQLTTRGEALVEALPDRERVREALEVNPMVGRKRRSRGRDRGKQKSRT